MSQKCPVLMPLQVVWPEGIELVRGYKSQTTESILLLVPISFPFALSQVFILFIYFWVEFLVCIFVHYLFLHWYLINTFFGWHP